VMSDEEKDYPANGADDDGENDQSTLVDQDDDEFSQAAVVEGDGDGDGDDDGGASQNFETPKQGRPRKTSSSSARRPRSGKSSSRTPKSAGINTTEARKRQRERENNLIKAREAAARNRANGGQKTAVQSLQLPYRIVKKIMKIDDEVLTVHNESAILMSHAAELFIEHLGQLAHNTAQDRGRSLIRYEDVVEARSNSDPLEFLETLLR